MSMSEILPNHTVLSVHDGIQTDYSLDSSSLHGSLQNEETQRSLQETDVESTVAGLLVFGQNVSSAEICQHPNVDKNVNVAETNNSENAEIVEANDSHVNLPNGHYRHDPYKTNTIIKEDTDSSAQHQSMPPPYQVPPSYETTMSSLPSPMRDQETQDIMPPSYETAMTSLPSLPSPTHEQDTIPLFTQPIQVVALSLPSSSHGQETPHITHLMPSSPLHNAHYTPNQGSNHLPPLTPLRDACLHTPKRDQGYLPPPPPYQSVAYPCDSSIMSRTNSMRINSAATPIPKPLTPHGRIPVNHDSTQDLSFVTTSLPYEDESQLQSGFNSVFSTPQGRIPLNHSHFSQPILWEIPMSQSQDSAPTSPSPCRRTTSINSMTLNSPAPCHHATSVNSIALNSPSPCHRTTSINSMTLNSPALCHYATSVNSIALNSPAPCDDNSNISSITPISPALYRNNSSNISSISPISPCHHTTSSIAPNSPLPCNNTSNDSSIAQNFASNSPLPCNNTSNDCTIKQNFALHLLILKRERFRAQASNNNSTAPKPIDA